MEAGRSSAKSLKTASRAQALEIVLEQVATEIRRIEAPAQVQTHDLGPRFSEAFAQIRGEKLHRLRVPGSKHASHGRMVSDGNALDRWRAMNMIEYVVGPDLRVGQVEAKHYDALARLYTEGNCEHTTGRGQRASARQKQNARTYRAIKLPARFRTEAGRPPKIQRVVPTARRAREACGHVWEMRQILNSRLPAQSPLRVKDNPFGHLDRHGEPRRQLNGAHEGRFSRMFGFLDRATQRIRECLKPLCELDVEFAGRPHLPRHLAETYMVMFWSVCGRPGEFEAVLMDHVAFASASTSVEEENRRVIEIAIGLGVPVPVEWARGMPHGCFLRRTKNDNWILAPISSTLAAWLDVYLPERQKALDRMRITSRYLFPSTIECDPSRPIESDVLRRLVREADIMACDAERSEVQRYEIFDWHAVLGRPRYDTDVVNGVQGTRRVMHMYRHTRRTLQAAMRWDDSVAADWLSDWKGRSGSCAKSVYEQCQPEELLAIVECNVHRLEFDRAQLDKGELEARRAASTPPAPTVR